MLSIRRKASSPSTPSIDELREANQGQRKEDRDRQGRRSGNTLVKGRNGKADRIRTASEGEFWQQAMFCWQFLLMRSWTPIRAMIR